MASASFQKNILTGLLSLTAAFGAFAQEAPQAEAVAVQADVQSQPAGKVIDVRTAADFKAQVLQSGKPVLAVFSAEKWCSVCRMLAPALDRFAKERPDVAVVKVDFDNMRDIAASYGVKGVPYTFVFVGGKPVGRKFSGAYPGLGDNMNLLKGLAASAGTAPAAAPKP